MSLVLKVRGYRCVSSRRVATEGAQRIPLQDGLSLPAGRADSHVGDEAAVTIASTGMARLLVVLANAATAADAPTPVAHPFVLKAGAEHWDAIDPPPLRAADDPLDLVRGGRKRGPIRLQQDELSKRTVPLGLGRRVLRKDPCLADRRRLASRIDVRDQPSLERRRLFAAHWSPLSA
jgi:hypothetical protein